MLILPLFDQGPPVPPPPQFGKSPEMTPKCSGGGEKSPEMTPKCGGGGGATAYVKEVGEYEITGNLLVAIGSLLVIYW